MTMKRNMQERLKESNNGRYLLTLTCILHEKSKDETALILLKIISFVPLLKMNVETFVM